MGDQEETDPDFQVSSQRGIRTFFSKIKQRAVKSLICSSSNVVPSNSLADAPGDAPPQEGNSDDGDNFEEVNPERTYGMVDLKVEALEVVKVENKEEYVEAYQVVDCSDPDILDDDDDIWEDNMWKKICLMKDENKPIDFRLYLVDMVRYSANIDDLKSMGIYITQLQREYNMYDNHEKIIDDASRSKGRTKFRVDGVVEDLILRLVNLEIGSDVSWKRTVHLICDRLKKNMAPKPKVDMDDLPKIFFRRRAVTSTDVTDSWFLYPTIDLTGYDLQGDADADDLRRRLGIFLSLRPLILVKLSLAYTGLDKKRLLPLLPHIACLPALQELDLRGNRLDTSIIKYFYPYLGKFGDKFRSGFSSLRWVYFNHNVDINCLPTRFIMGIDRRWPPIEHRPTPQELTESRAAVCDFSKIEKVHAKLLEKRVVIQKRARLQNVSKEKDRKDRRKAAYIRRIATVADQVLTEESLDMSSASEMPRQAGTYDRDIDGSDAGRTGRLARLARRAAALAARQAQAARAAAGANQNGNNAEGNNVYGRDADQEITVRQNRQNHSYEASDDDDDDDVLVDFFEDVSEDDEDVSEEDEDVSEDDEDVSEDDEDVSEDDEDVSEDDEDVSEDDEDVSEDDDNDNVNSTTDRLSDLERSTEDQSAETERNNRIFFVPFIFRQRGFRIMYS